MNVAVAGGTGFLGRHIVPELLEEGHDVVVIGRDPEKARRMEELAGSIPRRGDVREPDGLSDAVAGCEVVVSVVQFPNHPIEVPRRDLTYDAFDRRGTTALVRAAEKNGTRRFVYVSGAGADATSSRPWYRAKGLGERALIESDLEHTILRPSWAYGRGDRAINRLALIARFSPFVPLIGLAEQLIQPVHASDIARAVTRMVGSDVARDRVFEIGSREVVTMRRVIETMLGVLGMRRLIVPVPVALAKLATAPLVVLPRPPMTPSGIEFAVQDGLVDVEPMIEALGVEPMGLQQGLESYLAA